MGGSLITYLSSGDYSFLDNIQNTTDLVFVLTVTVFVFIFGDRNTRFNTFDIGWRFICAAISAERAGSSWGDTSATYPGPALR
ncbi:MAG: hypothetical protein WBZ05_04475 [Desulfobacterales bacterium]